MISILTFIFFYHKPQFFSYFIHIITHLHLTNDSWNLNILKLHFEFLNFQVPQFNYEWLLRVHGRLPSFSFFFHQNFFIKKFLSLVLYKFDFLVLKFKSPLLKPKLNLLDLKINIYINHLAKISLINMTLKWHYINMFNKIDIFLVV